LKDVVFYVALVAVGFVFAGEAPSMAALGHGDNNHYVSFLHMTYFNKLMITENHMSVSQFSVYLQAFTGRKWEKFNSEKVVSLAYARIQGKFALLNHFQNSSLMNEDKRCHPMLFDPKHAENGYKVKECSQFFLTQVSLFFVSLFYLFCQIKLFKFLLWTPLVDSMLGGTGRPTTRVRCFG
jgi:hypothetical protein